MAALLCIAARSSLGSDVSGKVAATSKTISVVGAVKNELTLNVDRFYEQFHDAVQTVTHETKEGARTVPCVPLISLVQAAVPRADERRKNHHLAFSVVVQASDGYAVAFSMGELLPDYGNAGVCVAARFEEGPLPESQAPARVIVPRDSRRSRTMYAVERITVIDELNDNPRNQISGEAAAVEEGR